MYSNGVENRIDPPEMVVIALLIKAVIAPLQVPSYCHPDSFPSYG
jgi:hypothetical protein